MRFFSIFCVLFVVPASTFVIKSPKTFISPSALESSSFIDQSSQVLIQGSTLKTWTFPDPSVEEVKVYLRTEGRPMSADVELWQGPDNTPLKMRVYIENGYKRPFTAVVGTPRGPNTLDIRNTAEMEKPLYACVTTDEPISKVPGTQRIIQGGALRSYPLDNTVDSVQIELSTEGRPLNAHLELLFGPNTKKVTVDLYTEDGLDRPFYAIIQTPGSANVVRIINTAPVEFPLNAMVDPFTTGDGPDLKPVIGGGPLDMQW